MPVINQDFENVIRRKFSKIRTNKVSKNVPIVFGIVQILLPRIKAVADEQKHIGFDLRETIYAFEKLEPDDVVAYDKDYQLGFPVGIGALKYYATINDPNTVNTSDAELMDIPDGAENKLNLIMHDKDPFKHTPREILAKFKNIFKNKNQHSA